MEGMLVCTQLFFGLLTAVDASSEPPMDLGLFSLLLPPSVDRPPRRPFAIYNADDADCCWSVGAKPETAAGAHKMRIKEESCMMRK